MISRSSRLRPAALAALLVSSLLHVAAMAISPEFRQEILVEGGDGEHEAVLGSDFADMVKAGDRLDPVVTEDATIAETEPVTKPTPVTQPATAPQQVAVAPTPPVETAPSPTLYKVEPAQDEGPVAPATTVRVKAVSPQAPAVQSTEITPTKTAQDKPERIEQKMPVETVKPVEEPVIAEAPVPTPRPKSEKPSKPRVKTSAGSETSKSKVNNKAGSSDGSATAKAETSGKSKSKPVSANSGNAAAANYPGKVYAKIARTRQRNAGGKGVAHVSFQVAASGQAVSVTLSRSSGNARVDKAALAHVMRAAPFPKPPAGARTRFVIPLEFRR